MRTEFDKFGATLERTQKRLDDAHRELDELVGVRTRQIQRRLSSVERIEDPATANALLLGDETGQRRRAIIFVIVPVWRLTSVAQVAIISGCEMRL